MSSFKLPAAYADQSDTVIVFVKMPPLSVSASHRRVSGVCGAGRGG